MLRMKAYRFRIYPTEEQRVFLIKTFGCVRFTYNTLLKCGSNMQERLSPAKLKKDFPFLKEVDSLALANAQRHLDRAFKNYYQGRASYPKLKSKRSRWQSYTTNNQQHTVYIQDGMLKVPKLKSLIPLELHREIKGNIKTATISAEDSKEFYVSLLCEEDIPIIKKTNKTIKIHFSRERLIEPEMCLEHYYLDILKTEEIIRKAEKRLGVRKHAALKQHKKLSQAQNYQKQKQRVNRLYVHRQNQKNALFDKLSIHLVREYDRIYIQNLPSQEESEKIFYSTDWQRFLTKLSYKAEWYGKEIILDE